ncbi:MAG: trimethylamine methyltransferase family protein [Spirochaetota bacterium]|nr:MAG: trimethylamine methyltransferase family protein [Spirochaetota bacterium]
MGRFRKSTETVAFSLSCFSNNDLEDIHLATLEILQQTGVRVESDEAMEIFEESGASVNRETKQVKISPCLVEDAIHAAPSSILLAGRNQAHDISIKSGKTHFTNFGEALMVLDPETGEYRDSTKQDVADITLVCDALSEVDIVWRPCDAKDTPPHASSAHEMESIFANTSKHIVHGPGSGELMKKDIQMGALVAGGVKELKERPVFSSVVCPSSPLTLGKNCCDVIMESARAGVPCIVLSMTLAGATSPVTLAGTLIDHNAEVLSGIVLSQLTSRGTPVIYGSSTTIFDLKTATTPVGAPELGMISTGVAKLADYYLLPAVVAGG